jgi:hypothetical protein
VVMKAPLFPVLAAALLASACDVKVGDNGVSVGIARGEATDEWTRTYALPAGGRLEVVNNNGPIEATGTAGQQVVVRAERRVEAGIEAAAKEFLATVEMREEVAADHVRIETVANDRERRGFGRPQLQVRYVVQVPAHLAVSFRTSNGPIRLENLSGPVNAATTNGAVQADLSGVGGDIALATTNGGIRLEMPASAKATLDASCVNGGINIDDQFNVARRNGDSRCRVSADLNGGGPRIAAATVNGGIRIRARERRQTD